MKEVSIISKVVSRGKAEALPSASASMPNWAELAKYVTIDGDETIHGVKDFANGLMIGGLPLTKLQDDVVYLDANLVVRGGITMFGTGEDVDVPTIMDALSVDGVNLQVINGVLTFVGEATGGVADSVRWENVIGRPTLLSSFTDDVVAGKYLPLSGGELTGKEAITLKIKTDIGNAALEFINTTNRTSIGVIGEMAFINLKDSSNISLSQLQLYSDSLKLYIPPTNKTYDLIHSGNYSSYALPLSGGTISGTEALPITIRNNINDGEFQVGIRLLNPNKTNTNGNTNGTAQFGYSKSDGVYMFNYDNYNYYNCAIGITDDGIAYVGKGGAIDTKYKIWHEGNDGSGSGLDADLLDGMGSDRFFNAITAYSNTSNAADTTTNATFLGYASGLNGFRYFLTLFYSSQTATSNRTQLALGYDAQSMAIRRYYGGKWYDWETIAFTSSNVASATKLQTARTIWGQSFDGTGNVDGDLYLNNGKNLMSYDTSGNAYSALTLASSNNLSIGLGTCAIGQTYIDGRDVFIQTYSNSLYARMAIMQNGNVGVGTTSPTTGLDIKKNSMEIGVSVYGSGGVASQISMSTHREGSSYCVRGIQISASGSSTGIFQSLLFNAVNYSTKTNLMSVDSSGNLLAYGGITMYSDQRKKTILNYVELSLKQIADAPLIEHYYNSDESKTTHVGSIAQYWASLNDWFCKKDNEGFYTMEIQNAALASAISIARELQRYESKTDKKIRLLQKRIGELEDEIENLKGRKIWQ